MASEREALLAQLLAEIEAQPWGDGVDYRAMHFYLTRAYAAGERAEREAIVGLVATHSTQPGRFESERLALRDIVRVIRARTTPSDGGER